MPGHLTGHIVIVGGGTAGWLTAARLGAMPDVDRRVTLIESPEVASVGVGEGTWPTMRATLQAVGLPERAVLAECDASFKQGTLFKRWRCDSPHDTYLHPFSLPPDYATRNLAEYWRDGSVTRPFDQTVTPQYRIATMGRAPKGSDAPDYAFAMNYGYHFDAVKFAALLRRHCLDRLGVRHIQGHVSGVSRDDEGFLESVSLDSGEAIGGDIFIDCSGHRGLLIGDHFGVEPRSLCSALPNNRAVVTQVPYQTENDEIHSCTRSTAMANGWIWDIGLQSRRGVGYVHCADFISEDEAQSELQGVVAAEVGSRQAAQLNYRVLHFKPGYRDSPGVKNCVAVGLSAGCIEPLEASALAMIEQALNFLVDCFPCDRELMGPASRAFNAKMRDHWRSIEDFLKLHYVLSGRRDSPYWRAVTDPATASDNLNDKLALWRVRAPWHADAPRVDELFPAASYQYVWLGMGGHVGQAPEEVANRPSGELAALDRVLHDVQRRSAELVRAMPSNRELLRTLAETQPGESMVAS